MKRKRYTPEQIIRRLRDAEADLAAGLGIGEICRKLGVGEATFHRWRNQYGGMKAEQMKQLKRPEKEDTRLKKLVAELSLDKQIFKEMAEGNF